MRTTWSVQCYEPRTANKKRCTWDPSFPAVCSTACVREMITTKSEVLAPENFAEDWSCKTELLTELEQNETTGSAAEKGRICF